MDACHSGDLPHLGAVSPQMTWLNRTSADAYGPVVSGARRHVPVLDQWQLRDFGELLHGGLKVRAMHQTRDAPYPFGSEQSSTILFSPIIVLG